MVTWHKMKDEAEDMVMLVSSKLPGKMIIWLTFSVCLLIIFVLGFGIGYGSGNSSACKFGDCAVPVYYFVSNHTESCPPLAAERLTTTVAAGQSFEGLSVTLQCRGNYVPYPRVVKCRRKKVFSDQFTLEWSNLPVCYPTSLISLDHWKQTLHAQSVVCGGDPKSTSCSLRCILDFIAVEENEYKCDKMPCPAWNIKNKVCYQCNKYCDMFQKARDPDAGTMLSQLSCDSDCTSVVVTSSAGAGVWQNKRTGLFNFVGEHNGRPLFKKNSTHEYLYYLDNSEWLIGPDFKKSHGGIQLFNNKDGRCPERHGGTNHTKVYIDSSVPLTKSTNIWKQDDTISISCYNPKYTKVVSCSCPEYEVINDSGEDTPVPQYYTGKFTKLDKSKSYDLLAPVYYDALKQLYLFSHHPEGLVWQISQNFITTPVRAVTTKSGTCPDDPDLWEWYNVTTTQHQQIYVSDSNIKLKCNY